VGGNDAGFAGILFTCATTSCYSASNESVLNAAIDGLGPQLQQLYESIRVQTFGARVVVLGYPQIFPATPTEQGCPSLRPFSGEQDFLRRATTRMNAIVAQAASRAGVDYVDVTAAFAGHEVCGTRGAWINGISGTIPIRRGVTDPESFHPTVEGQRQYAIAVNAAIAQLGWR
jgi:hypothetical protein